MIKLEKIRKAYKADNEWIPVLKNIDLEVHKGDFLAIMGPSGSGKSTLLNLIGFVDRKYLGNYYLENEIITSKSDNDLSKLRNQRVGFVFQQFNLIETLTIRENVELPLLYDGWNYRQTKKRVDELLEKLGIGDKGNKLPKQLSGGQQQRAAIARAIINNPDFIIADEPTGALDTKTSNDIMNVFKQLNQEEGVTIILVTHDPETVQFCNRVVHMHDGKLNEKAR
ncbi:putative ABC transport system ATP-binding protein [Desemzia incerta]|uniref:Putative ABC transport system ATP-binding protein n=1 Tax=Desemzia incerta TaxID=82801 RepID=A0A1I5X491_9LACT|nr:ABC transporter ATP-binding protein [Desemzia incerta]SFQ26681.1 putative ABC transport system ATP-binding protein [Desemzia incerta]